MEPSKASKTSKASGTKKSFRSLDDGCGVGSRSDVVYIGVGSNKGNRRRHITRALSHLRERRDIRVEAVSPFYETSPQGGPSGQRKYWNGVVRIRTALSSDALLCVLKDVEARVGRLPGVRWGAREVDLDILMRGKQVARKRQLCIPHPRMNEREFVLRPLSDLAPRLRHPVTQKTVAAHLKRAVDSNRPQDARIADFL